MEKVIAVDAMGGDHAPSAAVEGAVSAIKETDKKILLIGRSEEIKEELKKYDYDISRIEIYHADEVVGTDEVPIMAIRRKKDSSLMKGLTLIKEGKAHAFVSAGNTGALLAGATLHVGRLKGVKRPVLGATMPTLEGYTLLVDSGANVDCEPEYLEQFAVMGSLYMEEIMKIKNPTVGLLNNGVEEEKGNALTKETYKLLSEREDINFVGNIEARDVSAGVVDVIVADGFAGNVLLKNSEGLASSMLKMIKEALMSSPVSKVGALLSKNAFKKLAKKLDYAEVGGAPLLGLNGLVVKAHGSSNGLAFSSAIKQCDTFLDTDIISKMSLGMEESEGE